MVRGWRHLIYKKRQLRKKLPFLYYKALPQEHFATHFTRQANEVITKEKDAKSNPTIIVPIALVVAKVIPRRITDVKIVPRIPISKIVKTEHRQVRVPVLRVRPAITGNIARYTTAIPKRTQRKAGVTAIIPVKLSAAAIIPMIMLATTAV